MTIFEERSARWLKATTHPTLNPHTTYPAHTLALVSLDPKIVKIDQEAETGQRSKEIGFETTFFQLLPNINLYTKFYNYL